MAKALQLLRSNTLYTTREEAINALKAKLAGASDGEPILARYGADGGEQTTILGIAGKGESKYTIFEGNAVTEALQSIIDQHETSIGLDADGKHVASGGHYTNDATTIAGEIAALDAKLFDAALTEVGAEGSYIKLVSQADGKVSATAAAFDSEVAAAYAENEGKNAPNVKAVRAAIDAAKTAAVEEVDVKVDAETNKFLTGFEIVDGKLKENSTTSATFASANKTVVVNGLDLSVNVDGETIVIDNTAGNEGKLKVASAALTQYVGSDAIAVGEVDEDNNKEISVVISADDKFLSVNNAGGKEGLMATLNVVKITEGLGANIKEAYKITDKNNDQVGVQIPVYKDSSVKDVHIGVKNDGEDEQRLYLTYIKTDGTEETVSVDFSSFIAEAEMGNGMKVVDHKVSIDLAAGAEFIGFTEADGDGHKQLTVTGINEAIDAAAAASKTVVKDAAEGQKFVNVTASVKNGEGEDGHTEYSVAVNDIASDAELTNVETAVGLNADGTLAAISGKKYINGATSVMDAIKKLDTKLGEAQLSEQGALNGQYIKVISQADGKVSATAQAFDTVIGAAEGNDAATNNVAPTSLAVRNAIDAAAAASKTVVSGETATSGPAVKVTVAAPAAADGHVEYQVAGQDLASATELGNVITAVGLESDGTLAAISGKNYINGAASVKAAVEALDGALKTLDGVVVKNVKVNGVNATVTNNLADVTIAAGDIVYKTATGGNSAVTVAAAIAALEDKANSTLNQVEAGNGIEVSAIADQKQTVSVKLAGAKDGKENALVLDADGLYLNLFDCGTY